MNTRSEGGVSGSLPEPPTTAPDDASSLDDLAAEMEWERWRAWRKSRRGVPWPVVIGAAVGLAIAISWLVVLIVLGHAGWTNVR